MIYIGLIFWTLQFVEYLKWILIPSLDCVEYLVACGCDINLSCNLGNSPITLACYWIKEPVAVIHILFRNGANGEKMRNGLSPIKMLLTSPIVTPALLPQLLDELISHRFQLTDEDEKIIIEADSSSIKWYARFFTYFTYFYILCSNYVRIT